MHLCLHCTSSRLGKRLAIKIKAAFSKESGETISMTCSEEILFVHKTEHNKPIVKKKKKKVFCFGNYVTDWSLPFSRYDLYSALLYSVKCASRKAEWDKKYMCIQPNLIVGFFWEIKCVILPKSVWKKTLKFH